MGSAYANEQGGLIVSWTCLFTGLEMPKNMGQVKKNLIWVRKSSLLASGQILNPKVKSEIGARTYNIIF